MHGRQNITRHHVFSVIFTGGLQVVAPPFHANRTCHVDAGLAEKRNAGVRDGLGCIAMA
jgi:hypothetical protein